MLSPDRRTFMAYPRHKLFGETFKCVPSTATSPAVTTDREVLSGMLSPDRRTFITSPRHKLFREDYLNVPRTDTTPEATPKREENALTLLRHQLCRLASWIWGFIKRKDDEPTPPVAIIVEYITEVGGFSDSGYSDNRLQ